MVESLNVHILWAGLLVAISGLSFSNTIRALINTYIAKNPHRKLAAFNQNLADITFQANSYDDLLRESSLLLQELSGVETVYMQVSQSKNTYSYSTNSDSLLSESITTIDQDGTIFAYGRETDRLLDSEGLSAVHIKTLKTKPKSRIVIAFSQKKDGSILSKSEELVIISALRSLDISVVNISRYIQIYPNISIRRNPQEKSRHCY